MNAAAPARDRPQNKNLAERLVLRDAHDDDLPAIAEIYADAVRHGTGTFELDAPDVDEMAQRLRAVRALGWPWLVATRAGRVVGYAYANQFRPRPAYRDCLEDSVYVAADARGGGVGRLLLAELIARCTRRGARRMVALIGDADNAGSVALHRALGFEHLGAMKAAGWKFGRWLDVVLMQRALGVGAEAPADTAR